MDTISLELTQPTRRRARIVVAAAGLAVIASVGGVALATRDDDAVTRTPDVEIVASEPASAADAPVPFRSLFGRW